MGPTRSIVAGVCSSDASGLYLVVSEGKGEGGRRALFALYARVRCRALALR